MTYKRFARALMAGLAFPAFILPFGYLVLYKINPYQKIMLKHELIIIFVPIICALSNALYVHVCESCKAQKHNALLIVTGILLGLGLSLAKLPTFVWFSPIQWADKSIVILPIIFALIFRFIIKWCNHIIDVQK